MYDLEIKVNIIIIEHLTRYSRMGPGEPTSLFRMLLNIEL